ncbi:hypothetical protein ACR6C2_05175 [Streptomyces sp. INA 01156]
MSYTEASWSDPRTSYARGRRGSRRKKAPASAHPSPSPASSPAQVSRPGPIPV